ncbi:hypothetical protein B296_00025994, partial [Ensete ventricosum]
GVDALAIAAISPMVRRSSAASADLSMVYFLVMHSWFYSEKRNRKKQHMNRESDVFESSEASDGPEDRKTEEKPSSYDDKNDLEEQVLDILL